MITQEKNTIGKKTLENQKFIFKVMQNRNKRDPISIDEIGGLAQTRSGPIRIGSAMPKSCPYYYYYEKVIKAPAEISSESIIKAAVHIENENEKIHWENIDSTLQQSKKNLSRLKEIRVPDRKSIKFSKKSTISHKIIKPVSRSSSIAQEIKSIFEKNPPKSEPIKQRTPYKSCSLLQYINKLDKKPNSHSFNNPNESMLIKKCTRPKTSSFFKNSSYFSSAKKPKFQNFSFTIHKDLPVSHTFDSPHAQIEFFVHITKKKRLRSSTNNLPTKLN